MWINLKPFHCLERGGVNRDVLHFCDEVERVAAVFAFAETVPNVLADAHPELRGVVSLVNGAWTAQVVPAAFELVQQVVVFKNLLHVDCRFDSLEVNELSSGH